MTRFVRAVVVVAICLQVAGVRADAEDLKPKATESIQDLNTGDKATVERIMDTAVNNIARRYNLNKAQTDKTRDIMYRETYRFLREHEDQVWPLIRDFLSQQGLGQPPNSVEEMKRIGEAAGPMMELIREAIVRGNQEWRMFLTEEQKVMHDYDMQEIDRTFEKIDDNLDRWAQGDTGAGGIFPRAPLPSAGPAKPPRPPDDGLPEAVYDTIFEPKRLFDAFVESFIKQYRLDQSQIDAARSILVEYKAKAVDFKSAHKADLKVIGAKWRAASEAGDRKLLLQAERDQKELLAPIHGMLGEMQNRLMALLTTSQKQQYAARTKKPAPAKTKPKTAETPKPKEKKDEPEIKKASAPEQPAPSGDAGGE